MEQGDPQPLQVRGQRRAVAAADAADAADAVAAADAADAADAAAVALVRGGGLRRPLLDP